MKLTLDKIQEKAPELLSLVKSSQLSLDKNNLSSHIARVALMIDISGSMYDMFNNGEVNELVKRALPLALQFDDDGQVDVFCFNSKAYTVGEYGIDNYKNCVSDIKNDIGIGGGTSYASALSVIDEFYKGTELPVYLMFVTDGETDDKPKVTKMIKDMSKKPIFIQFIGLGEEYLPETATATLKDSAEEKKKGGFFGRIIGAITEVAAEAVKTSSGFEFLANLDEMEGRAVDNANFFAIKKPTSINDDRLYELLLNEYPQWLADARDKGILKK